MQTDTTAQTETPAPQVVTGAMLRQQSRPTITNPQTGNSYVVRKPDIADLIRAGVLPDNFVADMLFNGDAEVVADRLGQSRDPLAEDAAPLVPPKLTDADLLNRDSVKQAMVMAALNGGGVLRIVENPQADNECAYLDIPASDRTYVFLWATGRLPDSTVETEAGEVAASALREFPTDGQPSERAGAGNDQQAGRAVASAAVEATG